ncbi:MAG: STAS/SEC14 domain-containing protein [Sandaracinaceae bacterium]
MRSDDVVVVAFESQLTGAAVESGLRGVFRDGRAQARVVVDCRAMTGYSTEARERFVAWFRGHRHAIPRTAVVTDNTLWHMVVRAMALASQQEMRPFADLQEAKAWARG